MTGDILTADGWQDAGTGRARADCDEMRHGGGGVSAVIRIVAGIVTDRAGRFALVRKRGTVAFMQPGGKFEPGETARQALVRELREELGFELREDELVPVGRFAAHAANEVGHTVDADVFEIVVEAEGVAAARSRSCAGSRATRSSRSCSPR